MAWRGPSGKSFQTVLRFTLAFDSQGSINSVAMDVQESGKSFFAAFEGLNLSKEAALSYFSHKLREEGHNVGSFFVKLINSNMSIQDALVECLQYMTNNQSVS